MRWLLLTKPPPPLFSCATQEVLEFCFPPGVEHPKAAARLFLLCEYVAASAAVASRALCLSVVYIRPTARRGLSTRAGGGRDGSGRC